MAPDYLVSTDHWQDVLAGSILGVVMAYFSYRQYYPSLASEFCHKPYSPRIARNTGAPVLPLHHRQSSSVAETSALPAAQESPDGTAPRPAALSLPEIWRNDDNAGG